MLKRAAITILVLASCGFVAATVTASTASISQMALALVVCCALFGAFNAVLWRRWRAARTGD